MPASRETAESDVVEEAIRRQIVLLWQTRPLRTEKLFVADEIDNALTYLRDVFVPVIPKLYARWEQELGARPASFLRVGSWIGGDRDGNPFVTAETLHMATSRNAAAVLGHYIDAVHALGAELSVSSSLATVPEAVEALAAASGRCRAEPQRRTLSPRPVGHLCPAVRNLCRHRRARAAAAVGTGRRRLCRPRRIPPRPRHDRCRPVGERRGPARRASARSGG